MGGFIIVMGWIFTVLCLSLGVVILIFYCFQTIHFYCKNTALYYEFLINKKKFKEWRNK
jgi:hypothetical protein